MGKTGNVHLQITDEGLVYSRRIVGKDVPKEMILWSTPNWTISGWELVKLE